jgi:hypothetical protein
MPEKATKKKTPAKKAATPKPKAAPKPKGPSKAKLVAELKDKGIAVPEDATVADLQHRLKHYKPGMGYMVRVHRNAGPKYKDHPLSLLDAPRKALYWLPSSEMAERILATRRVVPVGRAEKPSSNMIVIDVPSDYEERFGHGGDGSANS